MSVTNRPARLSGGIALGVTAATTLALGAAAGEFSEAVLGLVAAALLTTGTLATNRQNNRVRAAGSLAVVLGGFLAVVGVLQVAGPTLAALALGLGLPLAPVAMALGVAVAPGPDTIGRGKSALWYAIGLAVLGCLAAAAVHTNSLAMPVVLAADLLSATVDASTRNDLAGLATLLLTLGALTALLRRVPGALPERFHRDDPVLSARTRWFGALLGFASGLVGLILFPLSLGVERDGAPVGEDVGGPVGAVLGDLGSAQALHAALAVVAVVLAVALAVLRLYRRIDRTTPDDVGDRLARATGGLVLFVAIPVAATTVSPVDPLAPRLPDPAVAELEALVASYGTGTVTYLLVVVALAVALGLTVALGVVLTANAVPDGSEAVALGAGLLFVGAIGAGDVGLHPLLTLGAGAAALFVWDVGENATGLGRQLGTAAETSRGEFVHSGASALVAGSAVLVAYGAGTVASAVTVPPVGWLLLLALTCSTVAGVSFLLALRS